MTSAVPERILYYSTVINIKGLIIKAEGQGERILYLQTGRFNKLKTNINISMEFKFADFGYFSMNVYNLEFLCEELKV